MIYNDKSLITIIGNGFDIAHGLKTSYNDFMSSIEKELRELNYQQTDQDGLKVCTFKEADGKINKPNLYLKQKRGTSDYTLTANNGSTFLRILIERQNKTGKWSDLESLYYEILKKSSDPKLSGRIKSINEEFEYLKDKLEEYLFREIESKLKLDNNIISKSKIFQQLEKDIKLCYKNYYFITFNYTSKLLERYIELLQKFITGNQTIHKPIYIHGKLNDIKNPIIFGYGDDNSSEYQNLQNIINNDLLVNFKTFQYLKTINYRMIQGILEIDQYKVNIIGHSCSLCDKTLLRSIFQHRNIKTIKAFYHSNESFFFENIYNISRIFDENSMMRTKIDPLEKTAML